MARRCPNKDKAAGATARLAIADQAGPIAFMVRDRIDEEGFRPVPKGTRICDLPVKIGGRSQKEKKASPSSNRFASLASLDPGKESEESTTVPTTVSKAKPKPKPY